MTRESRIQELIEHLPKGQGMTETSGEMDPAELNARRTGLDAFVNTMLKEAERHDEMNNGMGVMATLGMAYQHILFLDPEDRVRENAEDLSRSERELSRILAKFHASIERHGDWIFRASRVPKEVTEPTMSFYLAMSGITGYADAVRHHILAMSKADTTREEAEGNNLASQGLMESMKHLTSKGNQDSPGTEWAQEASNRATDAALKAQTAYDGAKEDRDNFAPARFTDSIAGNDQDQETAQEMVDQMRKGPTDCIIYTPEKDPTPHRSLTAYRDQAVIRVKRISEPYPDDYPLGEARKHATPMSSILIFDTSGGDAQWQKTAEDTLRYLEDMVQAERRGVPRNVDWRVRREMDQGNHTTG